MKDIKRVKDIENVLNVLKHYSGLTNLGYTHSKEYGYQLVLYGNEKGSIERTLGRVSCSTSTSTTNQLRQDIQRNQQFMNNGSDPNFYCKWHFDTNPLGMNE